jgi:hypothetical protein
MPVFDPMLAKCLNGEPRRIPIADTRTKPKAFSRVFAAPKSARITILAGAP